MTREEAIDVLKTETCYECTYGCMSTADCENEKCPFRKAVLMAINALKIVEEFERAQIVIGGRLNGRSYAYKCGLEDGKRNVLDKIRALETETKTEWIPVSERLPEDLEAVNITWVNHEPEPYYHDIKDRNFTATGIHYRGKWYWYSTTCADYLGEYGSNEVDEVDSAIEIVAWMPLPKAYGGDTDADSD